MFFPRTTPLQVAPAQVRGLRLSLNTPVVATEDLPIGPARAAILVHHDAGLGDTVTIGIRSLRASRVAIFSIDPDVSGETSFDMTLDAALSFAESMGFLFDEEELADSGPQAKTRCLGLWRDLIGDDAAPDRRAAPDADELLLEDMVEDATEVADFGAAGSDTSDGDEIGDFGPPLLPQLETPMAAAPKSAPRKKAVRAAAGSASRDRSEASDAAVAAEVARAAAGGGGLRSAPLTLSKFRAGAAPAEAGPSAESTQAAAKAASKRATALGRLRLVRRARDGLRKRNPILRLFGAF